MYHLASYVTSILLALLLATSVQAQTKSFITVSWSYQPGDEIQEDGFEVERSPSGCTAWEVVARTLRDVMSFDDIDVPGNCYRVRAFANGKFFPYSNIGIVPPSILECSNAGINSFIGCYYNNIDFTGLALVRDDPAINFNWRAGSPDPVINADTFSVSWEGQFDFLESGTYRFSATTDDGIAVYLDNLKIIDSWFDQPATTYTVDRQVTSGRHLIGVDYFETLGDAVAQVSWIRLSAPPPPPPPQDTINPTVDILFPTNGSTVARRSTVTIQATFTDNVGVVETRYLVNGSVLSCQNKATSCNWSVPNAPNKNYVIRVEARDAAGRMGFKEISVRSTR